MSKTILITRSRGDEEGLREPLQERGHHVIHEPLAEIFLNHTIRPDLERDLWDDPDGVIVTSRNGVRALASLSELRDAALLCVGEATAQVAENLGFTRIYIGGGTVDALIDHIAQSYDDSARLIYVSADRVRADLVHALVPYGIDVKRHIAYEVTPATRLSDTLLAQLERGQIDATLFLSANTAETFMALIDQHHAEAHLAHLEAYCLSDAVSAPLSAKPWKAIHVSQAPTLASLIESIDNAAA